MAHIATAGTHDVDLQMVRRAGGRGQQTQRTHSSHRLRQGELRQTGRHHESTRIDDADEVVQFWTLQGYVAGKSATTPTLQELRLVCPQRSFMSIADCVAASKLQQLIDEKWKTPRHVHIGGRPHGQVLDITHGLSMLVEKGLDLHGEAAVATADIRQYYDRFSVQKCVDQLGLLGATLARAVLRHQLGTHLMVKCGASTAEVGVRTGGTLTGNRIAVALGRVPVAEAVARTEKVLAKNAFQVGDTGRLSICMYIDHIIAVASSATNAITSLETLEDALKETWSLNLKPGSREVLVPTPTRQVVTDKKLKNITKELQCLGHVISSNGSPTPDWHLCQGRMWRAFWRTCGHKAMSRLDMTCRLRVLQRCVLPVFDVHATRWSIGAQLLRAIDTTPRKMIKIIGGFRIEPHETPEAFVRRRSREAGARAVQTGLWSHRQCAKVCEWYDHLQRPLNAHTWPARLLQWRGKEHLQLARAERGSSAIAGRTCTRAAAGFVQTRWHDGVELACKILEEAADAKNATQAAKAVKPLRKEAKPQLQATSAASQEAFVQIRLPR